MRKITYSILATIVLLTFCNTNVFADPVTVEVRVSASSDDAEQHIYGHMDLTSTDLELVYDSYQDRGNQLVGMRFTGVDIPRGANILNAYIQFQVDEPSSEETSLKISCEITDDARTFESTKWNIRRQECRY